MPSTHSPASRPRLVAAIGEIADGEAVRRRRELLLIDLLIREAQRRTKKKYPPAHVLAAVLDDLGMKLAVTR